VVSTYEDFESFTDDDVGWKHCDRQSIGKFFSQSNYSRYRLFCVWTMFVGCRGAPVVYCASGASGPSHLPALLIDSSFTTFTRTTLFVFAVLVILESTILVFVGIFDLFLFKLRKDMLVARSTEV
jgi:hypothetical protein